MSHYYKPDNEKRMVGILDEQACDEWLQAPTSVRRDFLVQYPADALIAQRKQPDLLG